MYLTALSKGAVESLVKFVKGNFLAGRTFYDDADLDQECAGWLHQVNEVRSSDATEQIPALRLAEERLAFGPLPAVAHDYGIFDSVVVNRESLVNIATTRYSVPAHLVGLALTARLYPARIELFHGADRVASHPRHFGRNTRIIIPEHFEAVFALKPRARVMVYRDWLVALSPRVADYISQVCRKRYADMDGQITALYDLAQRVGRDEFLAAVELATDEQTIGAEYVCAIAAQPVPRPALRRRDGAFPALLRDAPPQHAVERALADYEQYVTNRELDLNGPRGGA